MSDGGYIVASPCLLCGRAFTYNPDLVPSVFVDPSTNRPPDVGADGERRVPTADEVARAVRKPLCPECVEVVNLARSRFGMPLIEVLPGAYELASGLPS
jgi:hypothetical protein